MNNARQAPPPQTHQDASVSRGLYGWSPPRLPADTPAKRWVDRLLPTAAAPATVYFAVVIALLILAGNLPHRPALIADGIAGLAAGLWCTGNFWRCRHAHCVVTGAGWLTLGLFILVEAGIGHSLISGYEQPLLLAVLVAGLLFEAYWQKRHGTNAVTRAHA